MSKGARIPLAVATSIAKRFLLENENIFDRVLICGSIRRQRVDIGDLDIVVIPFDVKKYTTLFPKNKAEYDGMSIQLEATVEIFWGAATLYRTGSQEFNIFMRSIAKSKGLKLNEKGLWNGDNLCEHALDETVIFKALGIPYIEPERRSREYYSEWRTV